MTTDKDLFQDGTVATQWWYNTVTGKVEKGVQSPAGQRMGPYNSEEEASKALQLAQKRTEEWDDEDKDDKEWNRSDD